MKDLIKDLKKLAKNFNVVGIKQSFEDEGALLQDVILMRRITELSDLYLNIKIGGCEATSDINICQKIGTNSIVAPMVETEFALQKFVESIVHLNDTNFYINVESKTTYQNLDNMLSSQSAKLLNGIVVGRSDLTKSYGYSKDYVDSEPISTIVYDAMTKAKDYGYTTLMGGNISSKSCEFIKKLYADNLLDYIETRNVILKLDDYNTENLSDAIKEIILFESNWLNYKADYYNSIATEYLDRSKLLINRIDNE
jgi:hypothetical protein